MGKVSVIVGSLAMLGASVLLAADPPLGAGSASVAWGRPVDGLQAGIRPVTFSQPVSAGPVLEFEMVIRNVQEKGGGVISLSYPAGTWYSGKAEKGVVAVSPGGSAGRPVTEGVQLGPGNEVVIGRVFLGLPGSKLNSGFLTELPAGTYRVGSEGVLPPPELVPGSGVPPGSRYCPVLRTGYLDVELRAAK